jgi:pyruvate dehydrogenase E1 component beta subunit
MRRSVLKASLAHFPSPFFFTAEGFDYLDAPVFRVTGADIPTPYAKNLEDLAFPTAENVIRTVKKQLNL